MIELPPKTFGLVNQELRFVEVLLNTLRPYVSHDEMTQAISNRTPDESRIAQVIACKARKKLAVEFEDTPIIDTCWGRGYRLADGARDLILQAAGFDVREAA